MSFAVTATGAALAAAAAWAASLAPTRSGAALAGVLLVADDFTDTCTFSATDQSTTGKIMLREAEVSGQGRRLVSARLLADIARTVAKEPRVTLRDNDAGTRLEVSAGRGASWSLPLMAAEDFPRLPSPATAVARVDAANFTRAITRVSLALSEVAVKPFNGGILFDPGEGGPLAVVTGSSWRIAVVELDWTPAISDAVAEPGFPAVLVPAPVLSAVIAAAREVAAEQEIVLHTDGITFAVVGTGYEVIGQLQADVPDQWRSGDMLARDEKYRIAHVDVTSEALRTAIDRVAVVYEDHEAIQLDVGEDGMSVSFSGEKKGAAAHEVDVLDFAGTACRFGLNLGFTRDLIACLGVEKIRLDFLGKPHAPMTLARAIDDTGQVVGDARISVAPIRLPSPAARAA